MVEAPERIWANPTSRTPLPVKDGKKGTWLSGVWSTWGTHGAGKVEYVRYSDYEALQKELGEARAAHHRTSHKAVKRLRALWREKQAAEARAETLAVELGETRLILEMQDQQLVTLARSIEGLEEAEYERLLDRLEDAEDAASRLIEENRK